MAPLDNAHTPELEAHTPELEIAPAINSPASDPREDATMPIIHHRSDDPDMRRALEALSEEHPEGFSAIFLTNEQSVADRERLDRKYGRLNSDVLVVEFSNDVALIALKLSPGAAISRGRDVHSPFNWDETWFKSEKGPISLADVIGSIERWPPAPPDADTRYRFNGPYGSKYLADPYVNCRFRGYDQIEDEDARQIARDTEPPGLSR
jgi:hypothetical protein